MTTVDQLNDKQAKLEEELSMVKMQIAARHGESPEGQDVAPTREPADKVQAELSEAARKAESDASPSAPADPADDPDDVVAARGDGPAETDRNKIEGDRGDGADKTERKAVKPQPGVRTTSVRK